jgi:hypothetical protein
MKVKFESQSYAEVECEQCRDKIYVKKNVHTMPELIDD